MSNAKTQATFGMPSPVKLSAVKDKDEKRWKIEGAASTLKRKAQITREIAEIKKDPELFEAAKALLQEEVNDAKAGLKS